MPPGSVMEAAVGMFKNDRFIMIPCRSQLTNQLLKSRGVRDEYEMTVKYYVQTSERDS